MARPACLLAHIFAVGTLMVSGIGPAIGGEPDGPIKLYFNPRVPYEYLDNGRVVGVVAEPIEAAFKKADVPFTWVEMPSARQFHMVKTNQGLDCLAGRFKNADRESWAQFSLPVYRDKPQGLLVRRDNARLKTYASMAEAIRSRETRLLIKLSYTYGALIDGWIRERERPATITPDENIDMVRQIGIRASDAMVIAEEEAQGLIDRSGVLASDYEFLKYRDAPPGELRYIMCSHKVPVEVIKKLNAAITFKAH